MEKHVRGSCLCGAVAFEVDGPFAGFQFCHCSRCRKESGSAHCANIFVPVEQFSWERGETNVRRFDMPDAKYWCTAFCVDCGAPMPWLSKTGKVFVVSAGSLDDDPGEKPRFNMYYASRAPWYVHAADLDKHDEGPRRQGR